MEVHQLIAFFVGRMLWLLPHVAQNAAECGAKPHGPINVRSPFSTHTTGTVSIRRKEVLRIDIDLRE